MAEKTLTRICSINYYIQHKTTGAPKILARKLDISERTLYNLLNIMKENGAPIKYCRFKETYYYETPGTFEMKFSEKT